MARSKAKRILGRFQWGNVKRSRFEVSRLPVFKKLFATVLVLNIGSMAAVYFLGFGLSEPAFWALAVIAVVAAFAVSFLAATLISFEMHLPVHELTAGAKEIARGNFDYKIASTSNDELGELAKLFNYMSIEVKRFNEMNIDQILNEKTKTETIIRNIADGVILVGPHDEILLINPVIENWFGISEADVLGCSCSYFFSPLQDLIEATKAGKAQSTGDDPGEPDSPDSTEANGDGSSDLTHSTEIAVCLNQESKHSILRGYSTKVADKYGALIGIVVVLKNITKEKEVDKLKTELVSIVAHELRSPLTSITGFAGILKDPNISKEMQIEFTEIIHNESERLTTLVNKFLDISRIESGQHVFNRISMDVLESLNQILETHGKIASDRNIKIVTEVPSVVSNVIADPNLFTQVVVNLLSNAFKYSPENTWVTVSVRDRDHLVEVAIADQGYGIAPDELSKVFDKFYRVKFDQKVQGIQGSGLGLAFVKEVVEKMGGRISAESLPGKGSTFRFTLPKDPVVQPIQKTI